MSAPESEPIGPAATPAPETPPDRELDAPRALLEEALVEVKRVIAGQDEMLERVLVCLVAGGHLLIEGVPGLAKTLTIKTTAAVLGGSFRRIQFTPDLVPSDLVGTRIYRPDQGTLRDRARPGLLQLPPRRRDQPRAGEGAVRAARGDAGAPGDDRPRHARRAGAVPRDGDAEPDRVGGHVPASRGAGRPLHAQGARRLPRARRGADRRPPLARGPRRGEADPPALRARRAAAEGEGGLRRPRPRQLRGQPRRGDPRAGLVRARGDLGVRRVRREPARPDRARPERPRARARPRPRLRDPRRSPLAREGRASGTASS